MRNRANVIRANPILGIALALAVPAAAQQWDDYQGKIENKDVSGGKCTIEVQVDDVAEIEIRGISGRMRSIGGQRNSWRRMDCNIPLPYSPQDFRFRPQEGRGRQSLERQPSENAGVALIRIEDDRGGSDRYKFDIEWRGDAGGPAQGESGGIFSGVFGGNNGTSGNTGNTVNKGTATARNSGEFNNPVRWADQVNFSGRGGGYLRTFQGEEQLTDANVSVSPSGDVRVTLATQRRTQVAMTGRLIHSDNDRLVADLSGAGLTGTMEILLDSRNRVEEMAMTGVGRNRFELRWQEQ